MEEQGMTRWALDRERARTAAAERVPRAPRVNMLRQHPVGWGVGCYNCELDSDGVLVISMLASDPLAKLVCED